VPANRSRTERWRDVLHQIHERNGGLEFAVDQQNGASEPHGSDLVWRVRILQITDEAITVEQPAAVGRGMTIKVGTPVVCVMTVGQNRWMFKSTIIGHEEMRSTRGTFERLVKFKMPTDVQRCARRNFYRVNAAEIHLPSAQVYPLRDIHSAIPAEVANAAMIRSLQSGATVPADSSLSQILPDVGTPFAAKLMNVGGGGVGLIIDRAEASAIAQARVFWVRLELQPQIPAPIGLTARLAHTHIDSEQNTYAGMAFEFAHHPSHREFVVQQFTNYVEALQKTLRDRNAA
jgi:hypothetical protein